MKKEIREETTISKWRNVSTGEMCRLIRKETHRSDVPMTDKNRYEVLWCFKGYNPLPVKGWFSSSYPVLQKWLFDHDWILLYGNTPYTHLFSYTLIKVKE